MSCYSFIYLFHFKVMILESSETKWFGMGVVFDDYHLDQMPGFWKETVGYHTDDRRIFDADYAKHKKFKKTTLTGMMTQSQYYKRTTMQ